MGPLACGICTISSRSHTSDVCEDFVDSHLTVSSFIMFLVLVHRDVLYHSIPVIVPRCGTRCAARCVSTVDLAHSPEDQAGWQ